MALLGLDRRIVCLFGIGWLIGVADVQAQSHLDAQKRSFARVLARGEKASQSGAHRTTVAARHAVGPDVEAPSSSLLEPKPPHSARPTLSLFAASKYSSADADVGLAAATPVTPSGYGAGRDAFVEYMFFQTFGREIKQRGLDHLSRFLARGMTRLDLATLLWLSPEHRAIIRSQHPPAGSFATAFRGALTADSVARRASVRNSRKR